jgi:phosphomannomutase
MAKSGKKLPDLIKEVYDIVGAFSFERNDMHLQQSVMNRIVENTAKGAYKSFGKYNVKRINDLDGYKYFFDDDNSEWLLIRASGTEPVLRTYAESPTREGAFAILKAAEETLLS